MTKKVKENWYLLIGLFSIIIFSIIAINLLERDIFHLDELVYNFLVEIRTPFLNNFFRFITLFGNGIPIVCILIGCVIFLKNNKDRFYLVINVGVSALLNFILKSIFLRERPNILRIIEEDGYSFPSGHAMVSTAFYGFLIYLVYKKINNVLIRNIICILLSVLIFLIMLSRIYLGVHYTTDVIAGFCFSIFYLMIFIKIVNYKK